MTCIAGIAARGRVWIGADSAGVAGYDLAVRRDQKAFVNGPFAMGFTTSFRMGQLLRHALRPPRWHPDDPVEKFMVNDFVDAVRECLKKGGWAKKDNEVERGGTFLVGFRGRLFRVEDDYQVGENEEGFDACGCGEPYALGALAASAGFAMDPETRLLMALETAARFSAGVRGPFHIISTGEETS